MSDRHNENYMDTSDDEILEYELKNIRLKLKKDAQLTIATHNVRGITKKSKQFTIINEYKTLNLDIIGLSETNLEPKDAKYFHKHNSAHYRYFFSKSRNQMIGCGVGLLVKNEIAKYIHHHGSYEDRLVYIDLNMKGKIRMRIIQVYMPANPKDFSIRVKVNKEIRHLILEAENRDSKVILMGDFNADPKFTHEHNNRYSKNCQLYKYLEDMEFSDTIKTCHEIDESQPWNTWRNNQGTQKSRIDSMWLSNNLISELIYSSLVETIMYNSDHDMVISFIDKQHLFRERGLAKAKQRKINRKIYNYDKMTTQKWEKFTTDTKKFLFNKQIEDFRRESINSSNKINTLWEYIRDSIIQAAKENIPCRNTANSNTIRRPEDLIEIYRVLKRLQRIYRKLKCATLSSYTEWCEIQRSWREERRLINRYINSYKYECPTISGIIHEHNKNEIQTILHGFIQSLILKANIGERRHKQNSIAESVRRRCEGLEKKQSQMLSSILERDKRKIIIDKVISKNEDQTITLLTDEGDVKEKTASHFQNVAGSTNNIKRIPKEWQEYYNPLDDIDKNVFKNSNDPITIDEWIKTVQESATGSASGPSGISYEMLKHLHHNVHEMLLKLINATLKQEYIPIQWKQGNVYPIPKPHEWQCDLSNTRPIVLLETARKITTKILTQRLSRIIEKYDILKGPNYAALPHESTFEPIRLLDNIINDAKQNNFSCWLLFQDMAKAYDRVNIYMLELALKRLHIPGDLIRYITNLFTNRKNKVFTAFGDTREYEVLTGIDQGETISPLLWRIYYDPLLYRIKSTQTGYIQRHEWRPNKNDVNTVVEWINFSCMAFMDDTVWIAHTKSELEAMLKIADSFYILNDIKINKNKSILMTNEPKPNDEGSTLCTLSFGREDIKIKPTPKNESVRYLGVWFNMTLNKSFVINQTKNELYSTSDKLRRKHITDKQMVYVFNTVILPRIEYWTQVTAIRERECDLAMRPFNRTFKLKLKMSLTTPNAILNNSLIYNMRPLYYTINQAKIQALYTQINDNNILGKSTLIRLLQIRDIEGLPNLPTIYWPYDKEDRLNDHIMDVLSVMNGLSLNFTSIDEDKHRIRGGNTLLRHLLPHNKNYRKTLRKIAKHDIIYLEQLTSPEGDYLQKWGDMNLRNYSVHTARKIPKWFTEIESTVLIEQGHTRRLKQTYIANPANLDSFKITHPTPNNKFKREWVAVWHTTTNSLTIGKTRYKDNTHVYVQHFESINNDATVSPSQGRLTVKKCNGCIKHDITSTLWVSKQGNITCLAKYLTNEIYLLSQRPNKTVRREEWDFPFSLNVISQLAYQLTATNQLNLRQTNWSPSPSACYSIDRYIEDNTKHINNIAERFREQNTFQFFTDGAISTHDNEKHIGIGWVETSSSPNVEFYGKVKDKHANSTHAEILSVLTVLCVVPAYSLIYIHTDSNNLIREFDLMTNLNRNKHIRTIARIDHHVTWSIIMDVIEYNNIDVNFVKVKAHDANPHNIKADLLAKRGLSGNIITICFEQSPQFRHQLTYDNNTLQLDTRRFVKHVTQAQGFMEFYKLKRNYRHYNQAIDWISTFKALNEEEHQLKTNFESSHVKSKRVKRLLEELPTLQVLHERFPDVYNGGRNLCLRCRDAVETFDHVWRCPKVKSQLQNAIVNSFNFLKNDLQESNTNFASSETKKTAWFDIKSSSYWRIHDNNGLSFIDLIKGIVPSSLLANLHIIVNDKRKAQKHVTLLMNQIFHNTHTTIWQTRNEFVAKCPSLAQKPTSFWTERKRNIPPRSQTHNAINNEDADIIEEQKYDSWQELIDWQLMNGRHFSEFLEG